MTYERSSLKRLHDMVIGTQHQRSPLYDKINVASNFTPVHNQVFGHAKLRLQKVANVANQIFRVVLLTKRPHKATILVIKNLFDQTLGQVLLKLKCI